MKRLLWLTILATAAAFGQDPPSRVARLNYVHGAVSFQPGSLEEWAPATVNYPLTTGDHLYTDRGARAELQAGGVAVRLDSGTDFTLLNLDDRIMQISLTSGALSVRVRRFYAGDVFEIDTPNGSVSLLRAGEYRVDCDPGRNATMVTVLNGDAEMFNNNQSFPVHLRQTGFFSEDGGAQVDNANPPDDFDRFAFARDRREDIPPPPYVSREMIGYQDLEEYGSWRDVPEYGPVWTPRVSAGWAPYRDGHWAWVAPWGWTWVDDSPWGFAPFHYGRWAYLGDTWGWVPGPVVARPVYAPALVAFVGGNNWGVSLNFGGGGGVGWFPLGPRDVYVPSYHASRNYVNQVNITNVRNINITNVNNITNLRNVTYVNQNIPGAVTAISRQDFASARSVRQAAIPVPMQALAGVPVIANAPIAPQRVSVLGTQLRGNSNVGFRPPPQVNSRPVFVRNAPPSAPVPFAVRQQAEAATPGRPLDPVLLQRLQQQNAPAQRTQFRPAVTPGVSPQPGTPKPAFNRPQPVIPGANAPQSNAPFTRQSANPPAVPQQQPNPNFDRQRQIQIEQQQRQQQQPNGQVPFTRQPVTPGVAQPQQNNQNADRERQMQMEQQRQQQLQVPRQPQQQMPQPNADLERQRQMQLQMEQQRQMQLERQRQQQQQPSAPNADAERQRQMQLQMEQQRQMQLERQRQQQQQPSAPNADAERQRQMQLQMEQQRQMQLERQRQQQQQTSPSNGDAERQRQMQLQVEQQRQMQLERQRQQQQQANPNFDRQRQLQEQQRQMQIDRQRQEQQQQRQAAPPPPARPRQPEEKPKDEKKPPANQGF